MTRDPSRLTGRTFDLLIVGGGIMGAGIAWDAAQRGLSCALIEREDFASGASSKTTKLIHGGIRYLEQLDFGLVRQSIQERRLLLDLAPHSVHSLPFLIPVADGSPRPWFLVKWGVILYDLLAGSGRIQKHRFLNRERLGLQEPLLRQTPFQKGVLYADAQMDDVRLVLDTLQAAAEAGAVLANHCAVVGFLNSSGRLSGMEVEDRLSGKRFQVDGKAVINAAGPWVDRLRRMADPNAKPIVRPSKGIHLVYPDLGLRQALLLSAPKDRRIFFLIPWKGMTLIGTTDTDYAADPGDCRAEPEDLSYLLEQTSRLLPGLRLERQKIISTFAGVRPLILQEKKDPWAVSRSHLFHEDANGLISVVGGKFTTFRHMAQQLVDRVAKRFPGKFLAACSTAQTPLVSFQERKAQKIREWVAADSGLGERLCPHHPWIRADLRYAVEQEMAMTLSDLLCRRFEVGHSTCHGLDMAPLAAARMGELLGWSDSEPARQIDRYREEVERTWVS